MKYIMVIVYALISNAGLVLIKLGSNKGLSVSFHNGFLGMNLSFLSLLGFCMYIISFLIYIFLIPKFNLTYIIPLASAISYIMIFLVSILVMKEQMSICQGIGFFVILIGVVLLNIK